MQTWPLDTVLKSLVEGGGGALVSCAPPPRSDAHAPRGRSGSGSTPHALWPIACPYGGPIRQQLHVTAAALERTIDWPARSLPESARQRGNQEGRRPSRQLEYLGARSDPTRSQRDGTAVQEYAAAGRRIPAPGADRVLGHHVRVPRRGETCLSTLRRLQGGAEARYPPKSKHQGRPG